MLINKPCCDFKMCRNHFDGNCMNTTEYERCSYNRQKAEIERLKSCNKICVEAIGEQEIELATVKSEAIKEYRKQLLERVKKHQGKLFSTPLIIAEIEKEGDNNENL